MPVKIDDHTYACSFCQKVFASADGRLFEDKYNGNPEMRATVCEQSHHIIYFPIVKEELQALIQFIYTKDDSLIKESLYKRMHRFLKGNTT